MRSAKYIERRIAQRQREIGEIDEAFYHTEKNRRDLLAGMLERKRDDMVRSAVLQIHTAIEDLLTLHLACVLLQTTLRCGVMRVTAVGNRRWHTHVGGGRSMRLVIDMIGLAVVTFLLVGFVRGLTGNGRSGNVDDASGPWIGGDDGPGHSTGGEGSGHGT